MTEHKENCAYEEGFRILRERVVSGVTPPVQGENFSCECENCPYKEGFRILEALFDDLPDEEKSRVDVELRKLGL